jgi:hypothetical protein
MPKMNGFELYTKTKKDRKNMNHVEKDSPEEGKRYFIQKWRAQQH